MNRVDAGRVLAILKAAYPSFYRDYTEAEALAVVNLWAEMFAEDDAREVAAAIKAMIATRTSNFPPVIGEVKEALQKLRAPERMTEQEAWAIVSRAAASCDLQEPQRTYDKLPPLIRRVVGSPSMLKQWALADVGEFQTVIASNFQRSYRAISCKAWEEAKLPGSILKAIPEIAKIGLPDGK